MRSLQNRIQLAEATTNKLASQKASLMRTAVPCDKAEERFDAARQRVWFDPIRTSLMGMAGPSRTCMFCDHNEPTDVEHFKPKSAFPSDTFNWENMLWLCTTCNRLKGASFPPHNCVGSPLIDPVVDNVWHFFFLDEFGNLIKCWDTALNGYNERADSTCQYVKIDREEIQVRRQKRMKGLIHSIEQAIGEFRRGEATINDLNLRVMEWFAEPFQADVVDFCLRGPGKSRTPFRELLALGISIPVP